MASYTLSPIGGAGSQFFDNSGNVLSGGKLYTYAAGTTTPQTTWTTPAGTIANSNPIVFNSAGRPANEIWLSSAYSYKFVLKDSNDVLIATYDNIPGLPQPAIVNDASSISYEPNILVTSGSFVIGQTYMIASLGTTDFTAIGANYNSTGIIFTASGAGTGTGTAYVSTTVQTRLRAYEASGGSDYIGFLQSGTGALTTQTVQDKLRQTVSVKDFGAVGDGVTNDTAAIQAALDSGALTIDGVNGTYLIDSSIEIPTNCALKNINLIAGTAGMNCVLVNNKSQFVNSSIVGTGTTSIIERGVYPATNDVTDVVIDADISNLTVGIQSAPVGGTLAQRWTITGYIHDIVGTTGASEGYGVLLQTTYSCNVNAKFRNIKRHAVYLSAGSSYNVVDADVYECENIAVQIYSTAAQAESSFNTIRGNFRNLSQSAVYQGGAVGIIEKANNNTVSVNVVGSGTTSTAVYIEGSSGGPYPRQNIVTNCNITGSYLASVILSLNADGTVITNNTIYATWAVSAVTLNVAGTATVTSGGFVESNYINCTSGTGNGIINAYEYMYYIGLNQLSNIGGTRVVDYSVAQRRVGHSREYKGKATVTAVAAGGFGDVVVTMPDTVINATTMATVNGGTVSSASSLTCLAGNVSGNTFTIRAFNGAAVPQDIEVFWSVIGD